MTDQKLTLLEKIKTRQARIAVIGLGYVGLPLAVEFAKAGFATVGIDLDRRKVEAIRLGQSYIQDVATSKVAALVGTRRRPARWPSADWPEPSQRTFYAALFLLEELHRRAGVTGPQP